MPRTRRQFLPDSETQQVRRLALHNAGHYAMRWWLGDPNLPPHLALPSVRHPFHDPSVGCLQQPVLGDLPDYLVLIEEARLNGSIARAERIAIRGVMFHSAAAAATRSMINFNFEPEDRGYWRAMRICFTLAEYRECGARSMIALTKAVHPVSDLSNDIARHRLLVTARGYTKRIMASEAMRKSLEEMVERLTVVGSLPRNEVISILTNRFRGGVPPCSTGVWRERLNIDPPRPQSEPRQATESKVVREICEVGTVQTVPRSQFFPSGRRALNLNP